MVYVGMVPPGGPSGQMKAGWQHIPFHGMTHPCRRICRPRPIARAARTVGHGPHPRSHPVWRSSRLIYHSESFMQHPLVPETPRRTPPVADVCVQPTARVTSCGGSTVTSTAATISCGRDDVRATTVAMSCGTRSHPNHHRNHLVWWLLATQAFCAAFFYHISYLCGIFSSSMSTLPACEITNRQVDDVPFLAAQLHCKKLPQEIDLR